MPLEPRSLRAACAIRPTKRRIVERKELLRACVSRAQNVKRNQDQLTVR